MLVIRLFRVGKKNQPSFKIVVTDKRNPPRAGRFVEEVGFWNPLTKEKSLRQERIKYWISVGAKPSPTVFNLLVSEKILEGKKIPVHKKAKEKSASSPDVPKSRKEGEPASVPTETVEVKEQKPAEEKPTEEKPPVPKEKPSIEKVAEEKPKEEPPKEEKKKDELPKK